MKVWIYLSEISPRVQHPLALSPLLRSLSLRERRGRPPPPPLPRISYRFGLQIRNVRVQLAGRFYSLKASLGVLLFASGWDLRDVVFTDEGREFLA